MFFTPKIIVSTFSHYIKCNHRKSKLRRHGPAAFGWLTRIIMWKILLLLSFSKQLLSVITNGNGTVRPHPSETSLLGFLCTSLSSFFYNGHSIVTFLCSTTLLPLTNAETNCTDQFSMLQCYSWKHTHTHRALFCFYNSFSCTSNFNQLFINTLGL